MIEDVGAHNLKERSEVRLCMQNMTQLFLFPDHAIKRSRAVPAVPVLWLRAVDSSWDCSERRETSEIEERYDFPRDIRELAGRGATFDSVLVSTL